MGKHHGFTLVEMAVVIVIIGLIMAAAMGVGNAQMQASRISSTKQKQEAIKLSLINFITRNNRLPCPAIPTLAPGAVGYGMENVGCSDAISIGIIPWRSMGVSEENASDGYYRRFTYMVALNATTTNQNTIAGINGGISVHDAIPTSVANQSNICAPIQCLAVAAIISHGINGLGAYTPAGTRIDMPIGRELENADVGNDIVVSDFSADTANPFDDIVMSVTASDLLTPLTTNGTLKDYRAQLNDAFRDITVEIIATAINGRGPSSLYNYPIIAPASVPRDPWNHDIIYTPITPSPITCTTLPGDAFNLSSTGPDGVVSADDIQVTVSISQLKDAFQKAGC